MRGILVTGGAGFNGSDPCELPVDDGRTIPTFVPRGLTGDNLTGYGDGSQTRSFRYGTDLVDAFGRVLQTDVQTPINSDNPDERTILSLADSSSASSTATATSRTNHTRHKTRRCKPSTTRKPQPASNESWSSHTETGRHARSTTSSGSSNSMCLIGSSSESVDTTVDSIRFECPAVARGAPQPDE